MNLTINNMKIYIGDIAEEIFIIGVFLLFGELAVGVGMTMRGANTDVLQSVWDTGRKANLEDYIFMDGRYLLLIIVSMIAVGMTGRLISEIGKVYMSILGIWLGCGATCFMMFLVYSKDVRLTGFVSVMVIYTALQTAKILHDLKWGNLMFRVMYSGAMIGYSKILYYIPIFYLGCFPVAIEATPTLKIAYDTSGTAIPFDLLNLFIMMVSLMFVYMFISLSIKVTRIFKKIYTDTKTVLNKDKSICVVLDMETHALKEDFIIESYTKLLSKPKEANLMNLDQQLLQGYAIKVILQDLAVFYSESIQSDFVLRYKYISHVDSRYRNGKIKDNEILQVIMDENIEEDSTHMDWAVVSKVYKISLDKWKKTITDFLKDNIVEVIKFKEVARIHSHISVATEVIEELEWFANRGIKEIINEIEPIDYYYKSMKMIEFIIHFNALYLVQDEYESDEIRNLKDDILSSTSMGRWMIEAKKCTMDEMLDWYNEPVPSNVKESIKKINQALQIHNQKIKKGSDVLDRLTTIRNKTIGHGVVTYDLSISIIEEMAVILVWTYNNEAKIMSSMKADKLKDDFFRYNQQLYVYSSKMFGVEEFIEYANGTVQADGVHKLILGGDDQ